MYVAFGMKCSGQVSPGMKGNRVAVARGIGQMGSDSLMGLSVPLEMKKLFHNRRNDGCTTLLKY